MQGFDPEWQDFPHYIIGITKRIWEDRDIPSLKRYYADDMVLRLAAGIYEGNAGAKQKVITTLQEIPDRQLLAQDVIWCGTPEDGMLSSHRSITTGTHLGLGPMGAPTGKPIKVRAVADCWCKDNMIRDEWVVRDGGAYARQIGLTPEDAARAMIEAEGGPVTASRPFTPAMDIPGPYKGTGDGSELGQRYADITTRIMDGDLAVISQNHDRAVSLALPGGQHEDGRAAADRFWINLRAALPLAAFTINHAMGRPDDDGMPPRAALRWSLTGKHDGWGMFGRPTGAEVHIMGMSHAEFGRWGLRREWVTFDEVSIWKQILLHTGAVDA